MTAYHGVEFDLSYKEMYFMIRFLTPSAIWIALATCWFVLSASPTIAQQALPEVGNAAYAQDTDDNAQGDSAYYPNAPRRLVSDQPDL